MSPGSGRTLGISGWLIAAVAIVYLMTRYDVTIQERGPRTRPAVLAAADPVAPGEAKPVVDERYAHLATEARHAAGADLLAVDRRLEAAEREFPSDYRFTYERATLSVYGRADHHEAFFHLRRAAEKAIGTGKSREMLHRLRRDGSSHQRLAKLAVGHEEWSVLNDALEHGDAARLWHEHASHRPASAATPCIDALIALRRVRVDPEAEREYLRLEALCLRGSGPGPRRLRAGASRG